MNLLRFKDFIFNFAIANLSRRSRGRGRGSVGPFPRVGFMWEGRQRFANSGMPLTYQKALSALFLDA